MADIEITPAAIDAYAEAHTTPDGPNLRALADETRATLAAPQMLSGPLEGRLLDRRRIAEAARERGR